MKGLVDYIHGKGLKAGIYSGPGLTTCQGCAASYQHEEQDARTWAKWGFDYLKYDWCGYPDAANTNSPLELLQKPYILMRGVLDKLDRDIVFQLCQYGWGKVWEWGDQVGGNLWRVTGDITDTWLSMSAIGFQQTGHEKFAGPGHWNDTDMLVVGHVGWGRIDPPRPTNLTPNEQLTHISLWALQAAPLLIGADLSQIDEWTVDLLGNREVLADQPGSPRQGGWPRVGRQLDPGVGAAACGRNDGGRSFQPGAGGHAGYGELRRSRCRRRIAGALPLDAARRRGDCRQRKAVHRDRAASWGAAAENRPAEESGVTVTG